MIATASGLRFSNQTSVKEATQLPFRLGDALAGQSFGVVWLMILQQQSRGLTVQYPCLGRQGAESRSRRKDTSVQA